MATSKINIPQAAIFAPDAEQQLYARGTMDRDISGLAYMFKNAADQRAQGNQQQYMQGVSEANRVASALAQQELMSEQAIETLKQSVKLAEMGVPGSAMPAIGMAIQDNSGTNDEAMTLVRMLAKSKIAANMSNAAGGGSGSGEGGKDQVEIVLDATGTPQIKFTGKGPGADARAQSWTRGAQEQRKGGAYAPLGAKPPPGGAPPLTGNPLVDEMIIKRLQTGG